MNFVFLMDPLESVSFHTDTSFMFMLEAARRKHCVYHLSPSGLSQRKGSLILRVSRIRPRLNPDEPFEILETLWLKDSEVDAVFIRTDPPFNEDYLADTWLLDELAMRIPVLNPPQALRTVSEKLWVTRFRGIIPPTLITCDREMYLQFLREECAIVGKPIDGYGGRKIFKIGRNDLNAGVIFEALTDRGRKKAVFQKFLKTAGKGDKRILLLDGEILGATLRMHSPRDHRNNICAGGRAVRCSISHSDHRIVEELREPLRQLGLWFVGIDVIGDRLIEVNVTSPTCLQEINRLYNVRLEQRVIDSAEHKVKSARKGR